MNEVVKTEKAPEPGSQYSQAVKVKGFLFVSGQLDIDHRKGGIFARGVRGQTAKVMENIKAILLAAGYSLKGCPIQRASCLNIAVQGFQR